MEKSELIKEIFESKSSDFNISVYLRVEHEGLQNLLKNLHREFQGRNIADTLHLTLLLMPLDENFDHEKLDRAIKKTLNDISSIQLDLSLDNLSLESHIGTQFIGVDIHNEQITELHFKLLENLNSFRKGVVRVKDQSTDFLETQSVDQLKTILKYGYSRSGDFHHPHFTLVYPPSEAKIDFELALKKANEGLKTISSGEVIDCPIEYFVYKDSTMEIITETTKL